ncbi:MAG: hypothetical protein A2X48_16325 [Lentisphaerae bacterium GWF2_49_21]|nr:MAG: hypothetical protein A2X48_16325 [Lentisphaerae bacterium GWF2_49_21]
MQTLSANKNTAEIIQSINKDPKYVFEIISDGRTYTAIARHRERPGTRRAFKLSPDGSITEIQEK